MGNCIGDAIASLSLARKGYGGMAITGCFACPLFNFLIGFSLSCLRVIFSSESDEKWYFRCIKFDLMDKNANVLVVALLVILIILGSFLVGVPNNGFKFRTRHAYGRLGLYGAFLMVLVYMMFM